MPLAFYYTDSLCVYVSPKFQYSLLGLEISFLSISFTACRTSGSTGSKRCHHALQNVQCCKAEFRVWPPRWWQPELPELGVGSMWHAVYISGHISNNYTKWQQRVYDVLPRNHAKMLVVMEYQALTESHSISLWLNFNICAFVCFSFQQQDWFTSLCISQCVHVDVSPGCISSINLLGSE